MKDVLIAVAVGVAVHFIVKALLKKPAATVQPVALSNVNNDLPQSSEVWV